MYNAIRQYVEQYIRDHTVAIYLGQVTTGQIVQSARVVFALNGSTLTPEMAGQVYDEISLNGPDGEDDLRWLKHWSPAGGQAYAA
jgi:hypothetical protein